MKSLLKKFLQTNHKLIYNLQAIRTMNQLKNRHKKSRLQKTLRSIIGKLITLRTLGRFKGLISKIRIYKN